MNYPDGAIETSGRLYEMILNTWGYPDTKVWVARRSDPTSCTERGFALASKDPYAIPYTFDFIHLGSPNDLFGMSASVISPLWIFNIDLDVPLTDTFLFEIQADALAYTSLPAKYIDEPLWF
jgi:hypothetical protein